MTLGKNIRRALFNHRDTEFQSELISEATKKWDFSRHRKRLGLFCVYYPICFTTGGNFTAWSQVPTYLRLGSCCRLWEKGSVLSSLIALLQREDLFEERQTWIIKLEKRFLTVLTYQIISTVISNCKSSTENTVSQWNPWRISLSLV